MCKNTRSIRQETKYLILLYILMLCWYLVPFQRSVCVYTRTYTWMDGQKLTLKIWNVSNLESRSWVFEFWFLDFLIFGLLDFLNFKFLNFLVCKKYFENVRASQYVRTFLNGFALCCQQQKPKKRFHFEAE